MAIRVQQHHDLWQTPLPNPLSDPCTPPPHGTTISKLVAMKHGG